VQTGILEFPVEHVPPFRQGLLEHIFAKTFKIEELKVLKFSVRLYFIQFWQ
jgi:hypothetical protein